MCRSHLLPVALLCFLFSALKAEQYDIYLMELTIYQDHETDYLFRSNYPEVYLSCEDDLPRVNLDQVRRVKQLYAFRVGDIRATRIYADGCVECRLRESDATALLEDDTFGTWTMCQDDFAETGNYTVSVPGEFLMRLECPDCVEVPPMEMPPAPEPEEEFEMAAPSSVSQIEDDLGETVTGIYDYYEPGAELSSPTGRDSRTVVLQSEASDGVPTNGAASEDTPSDTSGSSSGGTSVIAILSLCLIFLVVGVAVGVALFWRISVLRNRDSTPEILELAKAGFIMKKANKV